MAFLVFVFAALLAAGGCTSGQRPSTAAGTPPAQAVSTPQPQPASAPPAAPAQYMGAQVCAACHKAQVEKFTQTVMGKTMTAPARPGLQRVDCEACHGPASAHVAAGGGRGKGIQVTFRSGMEPVPAQNAPCLNCHEKGDRRYWKGSPHESRDVACVSCHRIMEKVSDRAQLAKPTQNETCTQCHLIRAAQNFRNAHMATREEPKLSGEWSAAKTECAKCHNPHGSVTEKLLRANSVAELCYNCHPEKRGPFLWEHGPVRDSCANCHEVHGSMNPNFLKVRLPRLCQQCHVGARHPSTPQLTGVIYSSNRECVNCHSRIHGSNSPSGMFFVR